MRLSVRGFLAIVYCSLVLSCGTPFGIYHHVKPGQTLFRISQTYNVPVDKLQRLNRIDDPRLLQAGDLVFIPGADRRREVPTMPPSGSQGQAPARPAGQTKTAAKAGEEVRIDQAKTTPAKGGDSKWDGGDAPRLMWPTQGKVTSPFGARGGAAHDGIDISAPEGTAVIAAADGRVIYSDDGLSGYGNLIIVRHEGSWATVYAHNRKNLVNKGDFVSQGQNIATVGQTGRASGPHLHFELRFGKTPKDPLKYLPTR